MLEDSVGGRDESKLDRTSGAQQRAGIGASLSPSPSLSPEELRKGEQAKEYAQGE